MALREEGNGSIRGEKVFEGNGNWYRVIVEYVPEDAEEGPFTDIWDICFLDRDGRCVNSDVETVSDHPYLEDVIERAGKWAIQYRAGFAPEWADVQEKRRGLR